MAEKCQLMHNNHAHDDNDDDGHNDDVDDDDDDVDGLKILEAGQVWWRNGNAIKRRMILLQCAVEMRFVLIF